jgi:chitinase
MRIAIVALGLGIIIAGCSGGGMGTSDAAVVADAVVADAHGADAPATDAHATSDAGSTNDAAVTRDAATTDAGPSSGRWVMGYFPGYLRSSLPADEIDFTTMTHLAVGAAIPNADGSLDTTFSIDATNGPIFARDLADRAHAAGRHPILMLGGAGAHDGWVGAASAGTRAQFVTAILAVMDDLHFDGVDVDWEPVNTADEPNLAALVHALRVARPAMIITIPIGWINANAPNVSSVWASIASDVDQLNIMTYEMAGSAADGWGGWQSWHGGALMGETSSTPSSVDSSVRAYLAAGVPAAKLGIGVGFYGECWTGVTAPHQSTASAHIVASDNVMTYDHILGAYFSSGAYHYDSAAAAGYLSFTSPHGAEGCTFVSYEDETSIAAKGAYVAAHGLGGAIIWAIPEGHVPSAPAGMRDPLLTAMRTAFLQ